MIFVSLSWDDHVNLLKEDLRLILHSRPICDLADWRRICWEISNACLAEDWELVLDLYQRARELGVISDDSFRLQLGQLRFLLAYRNTQLSPFLATVLRRDLPFTRWRHRRF